MTPLPAEAVPLGDPADLFEAAPCGLLRTDASGTILLVNQRFCGWVGYPSAQLIGQLKFQELLTVGGKIFHQTHLGPLLEMQGSVSEVKLEVRHSDGTRIPMVLNVIRRVVPGGSQDDIAVFVAQDRHKYEQELISARKAQEELVAETDTLREVASSRAKLAEQMMGIVSHDLRNPLSTIQMSADLLLKTEPTPAQGRVIARINRAVVYSTDLIADMLDFTAVQLGGGISVSKRDFDLHRSVGSSVEDLALIFPERPVLHVQEGAGLAFADPSRLSQVIGNLVANAVAYGATDTPITVESTFGPMGFSVAVHNFGPAIPEDVQLALFSPMVRGTTAGAARSIGLGLFIVREIVAAHGGTIRVMSDTQSGTRFTADFPAALPASGAST